MEVCNSGEWGTVCDIGFDTNDALVICRQLGYNGTSRFAESVHMQHNYNVTPIHNCVDVAVRYCCSSFAFGEGTGDILFAELGCTGSESSLLECGHDASAISGCSHSEDVGIICSSMYQ